MEDQERDRPRAIGSGVARLSQFIPGFPRIGNLFLSTPDQPEDRAEIVAFAGKRRYVTSGIGSEPPTDA